MRRTATVIGSGPNGLAAGIVLAAAGVETTLFERNERLGGACSTAEVTLPGFRHDLGSSVYPMGFASPFFRSLPITIPWIEPDAPCAHPMDDGTAVMLEHSVEATADGLDAVDRAAYRGLMEPLAAHFDDLAGEILGPVLHLPRHPATLARFGLRGLLPAATLARMRFKGPRARALFAGMAAHSVLPLESATSAAVGLVLLAAGHAGGWPVVRGGAQALADVLAEHFLALGGRIEMGREIVALPETDLTLADVTPRQMLRIAGGAIPESYRRRFVNFRYGPGIFKVDYALNAPIPWTASECGRAATVHLGGTMEEIAASEATLSSSKPFVLLVQPSLFDRSRAPEGRHTAWAYCHVPNGCDADWLPTMERQITRFATNFPGCVAARKVWGPSDLEAWDPNLIGGSLSGGAMDWRQLVFRPTASLYRTPVKGLFLCGASTPPGGGVHGMAGYHAARMALAE